MDGAVIGESLETRPVVDAGETSHLEGGDGRGREGTGGARGDRGDKRG